MLLLTKKKSFSYLTNSQSLFLMDNKNLLMNIQLILHKEFLLLAGQCWEETKATISFKRK